MTYYLNNYRNDLLEPFINAFFGDEPASRNFGRLSMKTDIKESKGNYILSVEMPGVEKNDISLELKDGYLTISATVNNEIDEDAKEDKWIRRERFSGSASRSYYVGDIEEKDIKASFKDGILSISYPKESKKEDVKRTIAID